jgi:hypothetical protein
MGFYGLDVLAIRNLSRQLEIQAGEVEAATRELAALIAETAWFGADHVRFVNEWETTQAPSLKKAGSLLREASAIATRGAQDQERTSSV